MLVKYALYNKFYTQKLTGFHTTYFKFDIGSHVILFSTQLNDYFSDFARLMNNINLQNVSIEKLPLVRTGNDGVGTSGNLRSSLFTPDIK